MEDFINTFFDFINSKEKFAFTSIIPEACMLPDNKTLSTCFGDIISTTKDDDYVSLEMYKNPFDKENFNKSFAYACKLYNESIKNNDYKNAKKIYSINLMNGNFWRCNNDLVNDYQFINIKNNKQIDNGSIEMFLIKLDKIKNIPYNILEPRFITYLRIINAKSLEELKSYVRKDDEIMTYAQKVVTEWCRESHKREFEEYIAEKEEAAKKQGIKEGISEGILYNVPISMDILLTTAKNLLALNIKMTDIEKATGLSEGELLNLKKEL